MAGEDSANVLLDIRERSTELFKRVASAVGHQEQYPDGREVLMSLFLPNGRLHHAGEEVRMGSVLGGEHSCASL